ncbi:MAG: F0F1 ATP synthase subunit gamma [Ectothiorhodospiraceae bacterium]|jgi:F-type H+-transporting ATPase subunit gamma
METLERLAARVDSLRELQSIVRTMKALAAVNIRQYEQAVHALREYYGNVERGLQVVLRDRAATEPRAPRSTARGIIVFGSDHGLCGRFNEDLVDRVRQELQDHGDDARLVCVGIRPLGLLQGEGLTPEADYPVPSSVSRIGALVQTLLARIDDWQRQGVGRVDLAFNRQLSTARYEPAVRALLPVNLARFHRLRSGEWPSRSLPTYRETPRQLLSGLLRQYFFVSLFQACAESSASENASRLAAMQAAETNLAEHMEDVVSEYRRARQDTITEELLDVVSGYEALTGTEGLKD